MRPPNDQWSFSPDVYDFITVDKIDSEVELEQVCGFLKNAGIRHWLSSGTLLGIYRDGKFLDGDTDIDIGIRGEDVKNLQSVIPWVMRPQITVVKNWQSVFRAPRNIAIDIAWYWDNGDTIINVHEKGAWIKPKEMFDNLTTIKFKGVEYPCPDPEKYLPLRFKNWKEREEKGKHDWDYFAGELLHLNTML